VVFFATPHGVAMAQTPELLAAGVKVIDLAADFRLQDTAVFEKWYKMPHSCPELLKEAVYGLPELNRAAIKEARIIGNPGCYPTTMQLGLAPLLKAGVVDASHLIADCKSGVSGAGRKAEIGLLFSEASDNFKAYGVSGHRHSPETLEQLGKLTDQKVGLLFTPHLVPMIRGMHSTIYARLTKDIDNAALQALFDDAYKDEPFVDVMPFGSHPETRSTRASNMLRIALHRPDNGDTVVVLVVQDNLVKGSAGQAVQCMNLMFGLEETTGLLHVPVMP
jgi:N-acetyl-gamma-glutamyl-phosphate reductase